MAKKTSALGAIRTESLNRVASDSRISGAEKKLVDERLNSALREKVRAVLSRMDDALNNKIDALEIDYRRTSDLTFGDYLRQEVLPQLKKNAETNAWQTIAIPENGGETVKDLLNLDTPLRKNPLFSDEIRRTVINDYASLAGLNVNKIDKVLAIDADPSSFGMEHYERLVSQDILSPKEKEELRLVFEFGKLGDDNFSLAKSLKSRGIDSTRSLASWEKEEWMNFVDREKVSIPEGETAASYVEAIMANLSASHPSYRVLSRAPARLAKEVKHLNAVKPFLKDNPGLLSATSEVPTAWKDISPEKRAALERSLTATRGLFRGFRHLGIDGILSESDDPDSKLKRISEKIDGFIRFVENNPDIDLIDTNFFDPQLDKALKWSGISDGEHRKIRNQLMAYQRAIGLAGPEHADVLVMRGMDSAHDINELQFAEFRMLSGLPEEHAYRIYVQAGETVSATSHIFEAARVAVSDVVGNGLHVANWDVPDYTYQIKELDGFEELFGSQDYCDCAHCRSIFSPAAYFVDLMYFVDKNVSQKVFKTRKTHALYLRNRRPDLWKLELSCKNTNELIPYLDVVNEVLEGYLERALSVTDVYKELNEARISFKLPFNLYLEEIRIYLSHFSLTLFGIFRTLNHAEDEMWRERIKLSPEEWVDIVTPETGNDVRKRIGDPNTSTFAKFPVKDFMRFAGLSRAEVDHLLSIKFTKQLDPLTIIKEQSSDPLTDPLINYVEKITNLNNERLDFIYRYIRLWKNTGWTLSEFDLVLTSLKEAGLITSAGSESNGLIDKVAILISAKVMELQERLKLKTEELPVLFGPLPDKTLKDSQPDFFTRTFSPDLLENGPSVNFHHSFINNDGMVDRKLGFLLGGLGVTEGELVQLLKLLEPIIPFDSSGNTTLSRDNVSLLYKHARVAKALRLTVEDLIICLQLLPASGDVWLDSLDRLFAIVAVREKLQLSKLKIADCWFVLTGEEKGAAGYKVAPAQISEMVNTLQIKSVIYFSPTILQEIKNVTADLSTKVVEQMAAEGLAIKKSPAENLYRLTSAYQLTHDLTPIFSAIGASSSLSVVDSEIQESFNRFHAQSMLRDNLTRLLNISSDLFDAILPFVNAPVADASIYDALYASFDGDGNPSNPADLIPLQKLCNDFERVLHLFSITGLKDQDIGFVSDNTGIFGIADPRKIGLDHILALSEYRKLTAGNIERRDEVQSFLRRYHSGSGFSNEDFLLLSELWKIDRDLIQSGVKFTPPTVLTITGIAYLRECIQLCKTLGINGESLVKLKATTFGELRESRDMIVGAFASKYPDESERVRKLEPFYDKVNSIKRDALCDFIIAHHKELKFKDLHDLYSYFLLDVEMSGCFRTSKVVAGISSIQLYVFRCLMNLEQAAFATLVPDGNNDPDDDAYEFVKVSPGLIPAEEWAWRKNYRVWEANRKVFLYPENYILPEYRDNKSPIFIELEDELLQEKITEKSAAKAYQKYLAQFSELARMRINGCYFDEASDTYYFFGKTNVDPPQWYYRTWEKQKTWTAWQKIELGITSDYLSAIIYIGKLYVFWTEVKVKEETGVSGGNSSSDGFTHKLFVLYSSLDENNKWTPAQRFFFAELKLQADLAENGVMNRRIFPGIRDGKLYVFYSDKDFTLSVTNHRRLNIYGNELIGSDFGLIIPSSMNMPTGTEMIYLKGTSSCSLIADKGTFPRHEARADDELHVGSSSVPSITSPINADIFRPELTIAGRKYSDFVFKVGNQQFLIKKRSANEKALYGGIYIANKKVLLPAKWRMIQISTSLADKLGERLFLKGIEQFLTIETQKFKEDLAPFNVVDNSLLSSPATNPNHIDFAGSYGEYYWEIFFHIPFLIASHLNADQRFKEADWWYRRIFDPTSSDVTSPEKDRNWKFIRFRGLSMSTLQSVLTSSAAIEAYKKDPFNPHAIARLRLSAYQKTIVMKYIDNLIDWGDYLFAQDTMESINEATMLYIIAFETLGKRPVKLGECKTIGEKVLTYDKLAASIDKGSEFLIQLENYAIGSATAASKFQMGQALALNHVKKQTFGNGSVSTPYISFDESQFSPERMAASQAEVIALEEKRYREYAGVEAYEIAKQVERLPAYEKVKDTDFRPPHKGIATQKLLAFCIPNNEVLLKYWDAVEDRLFKIRNCMNISGVRRSLALFQPPIDPMLLVKAKAAGLSLEDILATLTKPLPHYRFTFLVERAKQSAQLVQSFGTALLSALEKKDAEELLLIRSVNEKEILDFTTQIKKNAILEAQNQLIAASERESQVQLNIDHYGALLESGLTGWEVTQQISRHTATSLKISESVVHLMAGITYLVPQVGSPFAMKYGGKELGDSGVEFAQWTTALASVADAIANSAGLEATFQRREEEWKYLLNSASQELKAVQRDKLAAEYRLKIIERDLEIHEKSIEHNQELEAFYKNKFSGLGLYNYLATRLTRLFREAYNTSYELAKLAEQAYQFERDDETLFIAPDNWQHDKAGLLSGEKLILQLQRLEKSYIENNRRDYEVNQSVSMRLWAPEKLAELKQNGSCTFDIPELAFDLYYPGQFRRTIKSVRLTLPCISGPYTNISCKVSLVQSKIRKDPSENADLVDVPVQKLTSIATSNAQNDSGVFELNFRDERYLPFEGAGAISSWRLELPNKIRTFDYNTIADVIFQISYTSRDDGAYREAVENNISAAIEDYATNVGLFRMFSLRHEFPNVFHQVLHGPVNPQGVEFELKQNHFPYMFARKDLVLTNIKLLLRPVAGETIATAGLSIKLNAFDIASWSDFPNDGSVEPDHVLKEGSTNANGTPLKKWHIITEPNGLNSEEIGDMIILMKYSIS